ncbi:MAG: fibronectin type III domain-containing protein, partial [Paludibacteraceae bacterium]|nr:fibronectin type III domain-containing protein [Paludibacteraceae bacterium]
MRTFTQKVAFALIALLCMIAMPQAVMAQDCLDIGDGTTAVNGNVPVASWYHNSYTQQLYTADEINHAAGNITSISFKYVSGATAMTRKITVYMANTDAANLSTSYVTEGLEEVFSSPAFTFDDSDEWITIDLTTPFAYDGTSNLVVAVWQDYDSSVETGYSSGSRFVQTSMTGMARYQQVDNGAYTLLDGVPTTTSTSSTLSARANIQICIAGGSAGPTCDKPEAVEANDVTSNSATINWIGTAAAYNLQYKASADADWTLVKNLSGSSYQLTNLVSNTAYQVQVQAICGENTSGWKSASFNTLIGLPYAEHFNGTSAPSGWTNTAGRLQADGPVTLSGTTGWSFGAKNGIFDNHAYVNIWSTTVYRWLISPEIPIPEMEEGDQGYQLSFKIALTIWGSATEVDKTQQQDDRFIVLASNDGGANWTILREWNNTGSEYVYNDIAVTGEEVNPIDLSAYAGQTIKIAFYGESTQSGGDNAFHLDDVLIDEIPTCLKPTGLHALDAQATSTTLPVAWTANSGETAWRLQYKPTADSTAV